MVCSINFYVWLCLLLTAAFASETADEEATSLIRKLRSGQDFPMVGYGVGNLPHELIAENIVQARHAGYILVDTAQASRNAHLIREGITRWQATNKHTVLRGKDAEIDDFHIVTKIWYTHLGYGRTKLAIQDVLEEYAGMSVKLHILIHWPRCRHDISWMDCEGEELNLPNKVKEAGPPPHLSDNAFTESWKALEEAYMDENNSVVSSIGVSNFDIQDLHALKRSAKIMPHILQDNVWNVLFNQDLLHYCEDLGIMYQVYNVMNGIVGQREKAPRAWSEVGGDSTRILQWLLQQNIAVIPRTVHHINENSPSALKELPQLSKTEIENMIPALKALMQGRDLDQPRAVFVNQHSEEAHIYWHSGKEEVPVRMDLSPGDSFVTNTYTGHKFVVYDSSKEKRLEFKINANYGDEEFHIEL